MSFQETMSSRMDTVGHRLLTSMIDHHATETPDKVYVSISRSGDLSEGFLDVTYRQFVNAVNHASWWLDKEFGECQGSFDTFAYSGLKDLRYPILAVAAVKVGRTVGLVAWKSLVFFMWLLILDRYYFFLFSSSPRRRFIF